MLGPWASFAARNRSGAGQGLSLSRSGRLSQFEGHRVGAGLAVSELLFVLGQVVAILGDPGLFKPHDGEPGGSERLPVVRERPVEPEEAGLEVPPGSVHALPRLPLAPRRPWSPLPPTDPSLIASSSLVTYACSARADIVKP